MSGLDLNDGECDWVRSPLEHNAVAAIESAAQRLGMDPAVLAERLAKGGIAELVEAARHGVSELQYKVHAPTYSAASDLKDALQLFAKE